jgi:protein involved in polysaccharide export with SLBB domain
LAVVIAAGIPSLLGSQTAMTVDVAAAQSSPSDATGMTTPVATVPPAAAPTVPAASETGPAAGLTAADDLNNVPADYTLDTNDAITIDVARHDDVSRTVRIPADGTIRLPRLLHPIRVRGLTCMQLADRISERLVVEGRLVMRPGQVTVSVSAARPRRVFVRGTAVGGREYDLQNGDRISELVASMGGVPQADRLTVAVTGPSRPTPLHIDLDAALNVPGSPDNIPLMEGDTVTIDAPRRVRLYIEGEGPRGLHEFDYRYGLKQMLIDLGMAPQNASGDWRRCRIRRKAIPGDPSSADEFIPVDLMRVWTDDSYDVKIQDLDTLEIPVSEKYIYIFGEVGGPRKQYLPLDRTWYLSDVIANGGGTNVGTAQIGNINVIRLENGKPVAHRYDFGRYLKNLDPNENPPMEAGDLIYVPTAKRPDVSSVWTVWGFYSIAKALFPTIPGSITL